MPAMRRSNCRILGAGQPPLVFASKRPERVDRPVEFQGGSTKEDICELAGDVSF